MARKRKTFTISKTRKGLYKGARVLGDVQAWISLSPRKVATRYGRKCTFRKIGSFINRFLK